MTAFCQIMRAMKGSATVNVNCTILASHSQRTPSKPGFEAGRQTKNMV
jgi:hypothetical protein